MSIPDTATFRALLANQGLTIGEERLEAAVAVHRAMREELVALRAVPLSYIEPVYEPGTAFQWIEQGGGSL